MKRVIKDIRELSDEIVSLISDETSIPRLEQLRVKEFSDHIEPKEGETTVLIPWSGGLDSTTALLMALESSKSVNTFFFDYGQDYLKKEENAVESIIEMLEESDFKDQLGIHYQLDIHWLVDDMQSRFLGEWEHIFPMRNLIILLMIAQLADEHVDTEIWFGPVQGEIPYSGGDKSEVFIKYMRNYLLENYNIVLRTPLASLTKGDLVNWATQYKSRENIIKSTISCFDPKGMNHCGKCQACFNRSVGFYAAGCLEISGVTKDDNAFKEFAEKYKDKISKNKYYSYRRRRELLRFIKTL